MKRHIWLSAAAAAILTFSLLFSSCQGAEVHAAELTREYKRTEKDRGEVSQAFGEAYSGFAFRLFSESVKGQAGNKLLSPLSAAGCLCLVANGAEGETLRETEDVLGMEIEELNKAMYSYTSGLMNQNDSKMELANSIWFRNTDDALHVEENYLQTLADWYQAEAFAAPFNEITREEMDSWVSKHTDGMIKKMLSRPISSDTMMYLANALVFDAKWEKKYEDKQVRDHDFICANGHYSTVKGLFSKENVYLEAPGMKGVAKQYKNGGYYFVGLLPEDETQDIQEFAAGLTGELWQELWAGRQHRTVDTMIPEFKIEDEIGLTEVLKNLGMPRAFTEEAEFLPMANYNGESLYVSEMLQKTYIELDRNGTKAAALTLGVMNKATAALDDNPVVYLDRPFVYMIVDANYGLPLFIGLTDSL